MQFKIEEQIRITTPNISEFITQEATKRPSNKKRLIAQIAAIHEGITKNYNKYTAEELEKAVPSWLMPYPKPILLNHNLESEPLGRIVNADFTKNAEGLGYIRLRSVILDPIAMSKVSDGRYLTGSVGGMPQAAICSICHQDVIAAAREGDRCGHMRGQTYEERTCVYEHRGIAFHEYSFVNAPGDSHSQVENVSEANAELSVFSLNTEAGTVSQFRESDGLVDLREWLTESQAAQVYMDIAFGTQYSESFEIPKNISFSELNRTIYKELESPTSNEQDMTDKTVPKEDVLQVAELLTDILHGKKNEVDVVEEAPAAEDEIAENDETEAEEVATQEEDATEETAEVQEEAEEVQEDATAEETEIEETESPEGQESKAHECDGCDECNSEEAAEESVDETETETEESAEVETEEEAPAESDAEASVEELQAEIDSLKAENQTLKEENTKMKEALHAELVEKVVDARIAVGHTAAEERDAAIEEYSKRSAQSLADTLVDVRAFAEKNGYEVNVVGGTVPSLEIRAVATNQSGSDIVDDSTDVTEEVAVNEEDLLVSEFTQLLVSGQERYLQSKINS